MTKIELIKQLHFDKAFVSLNPYFFGNPGEEKGVLAIIKVVEGSDLDLSDFNDLCFQCFDFVEHEELIKMVLFLFDKDDCIYDFIIAGSKYKIQRSEIQAYERMIGIKID